MKKLPLLLVLLLASAASFAQTIINGQVTDSKKRPVAGASVVLVGSYDGTTANADGYFRFKTLKKGAAAIQVKMIGYKLFEQQVQLVGDSLSINPVLKEEVEELTAATVVAGSFEAGDKKRAATVLSSVDMLTTGASNADVAAAIMTLPGAQTPTQQEGLAVRGGSTNETRYFIDGTMVSAPYYSGAPNIAQRSRLSPTLFKGTVFSTGGYSALYGQAMSSALILESIDIPQKSEVGISLSPIYSSISTQQVAGNKKSSYGGTFSYTKLNLYYSLVEQNVDYLRKPTSTEGDLNFRIRTKSGGMVKFYAQLSSNGAEVSQPNLNGEQLNTVFDLTSRNLYTNLSYREYLSSTWKLDVGSSISMKRDKSNQYLTDLDGNIPQNLPPALDWQYVRKLTPRQFVGQLKAVAEKKLGGLNAFRFGSEYWYTNFSSRYSHDPIFQYDKLIDSYVAGFAEADFHLSRRLAFKLGGRLEYSSVVDAWNVAPRLSTAYKTGRSTQLSASYGIFYQKPEEFDLLFSKDLGYQRADHYLLNFQHDALKRKLRIEGYYKAYHSLVKSAPEYSNSGSGYARGVDVYWRDRQTFRALDYWVSYSYLDSKRDYNNFPYRLRPTYAAAHTASVVAKRFFPDLNFGVNASYSFSSGRPYFHLQKDEATGSYYVGDSGKTITYNDLQLSINYLNTWMSTNVLIFASVSNVLGQQQVYGYAYSNDGTSRQPILPTAKRFFFLGIFLSWGTDNRQDIIDRQL